MKITRVCASVEVLQNGRIQILVVRSAYLLDLSTERRVIDLTNGCSCGRLSERTGVEPLRVVMRTGVDVRTGNQIGGATKVGRGGDRTRAGGGLAALEGV